MTKDKIQEEYNKSVELYEEGKETFTDDQFDILELIYEKTLKKQKPPFYMGSLDKLRPHIKFERKKLEKISENVEFVVQEKLDGVSCLVSFDENGVREVFKKPGKDLLSRMIFGKIKGIPKTQRNICVRGELIVKRKIFNDFLSGLGFKSPRAYVAGITNTKECSSFEYIEFVAYELVESNEIKPSDQIKVLNDLGFNCVRTERHKGITIEKLESLLSEFKMNSEFNIDGIVLKENVRQEREKRGNNKYSFAFKMLTDFVCSTVSHLEWKLSKSGKLKPTIKLSPPVIINGTKICSVNAYNANYVLNNKIGPGAKINIFLSGDVIPCILSVESPSENVTIPEGKMVGPDIVCSEIDNSQEIREFMISIGVKGLGPASIKRMKIKSIEDALHHDFIWKQILPENITLEKILAPFVGGIETARIIVENGLDENFERKDIEYLRGFGKKKVDKCLSRKNELKAVLRILSNFL